MKINNDELKKILAIASRGIAKNSTVEEFGSIQISINNNIAILSTANSQQNIIQIAQVETTADEKWDCLINYSLLSALVGKFSKETTELIRNDNELIVKNGRSKTKIVILGSKLPLFTIGDKEEILELTKKDWFKYFKPITYALATDDMRQILQCVLMEGKGEGIDIVSLDGYRLAKTTITSKKELNCLIDGGTIKSITDILGKFEDDTLIKFFKTDSKLIFTIETCSIISNAVEGDFINYKQILPDTDEMDIVKISKSDLLDALDRVKISQKDTPLVQLSINEDKLTLSGNSEIAKIKEEITIISSLKDFKIAFNIQYLIDAVKQFDEEAITIFFNTNVTPCVIKNGYMLSLILPVRTLD